MREQTMQRSFFNLPDKPCFRPDEVVRLTHLDGRVISYWAGEFEGIRPARSGDGEPLYTKAAVERILLIKRLLVEERLDKESVRRRLSEMTGEKALSAVEPPVRKESDTLRTLNQIKQGLKEILTILDRSAKI